MAFNLNLQRLAIPSVCFLIAFLSYGSQILFHYLEPGPLSPKQSIVFNILVLSIWWSYERTCRLDPGRLPKELKDSISKPQDGQRWCKKCDAVKPPRAHHCKKCGRCIPKMDHHCPWTANCVSHTTFPHFLRFVFFACAALALLDYHLFMRGHAIYEQRDLPSYLGPSMISLAILLTMLIATTLVLFALTILLVTATHSLFINTTMIETWEIERHESLVQRSRKLGGYVHGPGGVRVKIRKQEFPFDIGFWENIVQGMGTHNVLAWFLPWGGNPANSIGWQFDTNGFEDVGTTWPPVDPEKLPRNALGVAQIPKDRRSDFGEIAAFKRRQQADIKRWDKSDGNSVRDQELARATIVDEQDNDVDETYDVDDDYESEYEEGIDGEEGWTSRDGSRLRDFGVDEDAEVIGVGEDEDEDDIPLGVLIRRRKAQAVPATD